MGWGRNTRGETVGDDSTKWIKIQKKKARELF
jgi:hypothetical protein